MSDKGFRSLSIPITGRWRTSVDGTQLSEGDFQVLQNMQYTNAGIKSISGMTKINTSALSQPKIKSGIHFVKDHPSESHLMVQSFDSNDANPKIYQLKTAIPNTGDFEATPVYTENTGADIGTFSNAPDGCVAYCNGKESLIWGGDEYRCGLFYNYKGADVFVYNYSDAVRNTLQSVGNTAILKQASATPTTTVRIGSSRPASGFKFYVKTPNQTAATVAITYWNGTAEVSVANLVDNTSVGGKSLAQTGTIVFDSTVSVTKIRLLYNSAAYWYTLTWTGLDQDVEIYYVTINAPMQPIVDIWDGLPRQVHSFFKLIGTTYTDSTFSIIDDSYIDGNLTTYVEIDSFVSTSCIIAGFAEEIMGLKLKFIPGHVNTTAATTATVSRWNGSAWVSVGTISDGTSKDGISYNQSGSITWEPVAKGIEQTTVISANDTQFYYYKINCDKTLSVDVQLYHISGIPVPKQISNYKFPVNFHNRIWLCSDQSGERNKVIVSSMNTVSVFNGTDTGTFYIGDNTDIIAGGSLYSRYASSISEQLILCKIDETWLIEGTTLSNYTQFRISNQYGCVAPQTFTICNIGFSVASGITKHVAIWQASNAIIVFDGSSILPVHFDISDVFDQRSTVHISQSMINKSTGFFDETNNEWHWQWSSDGSTLNMEYVYDLVRQKWYKIDRGYGKAIRIGISVRDTKGNKYTYGSIDAGCLERLEYGDTFDGNNIISKFRTPDIPIAGWEEETLIRKVSLLSKTKAVTTNKVSITHYGDVSNTNTSIGSFGVTDAAKRVLRSMVSINTGPYTFHSFECSMTTSNEPIGFEPIGLHIFYKTVRANLI